MSRIHFLAGLFILALAVGCKAQSAPRRRQIRRSPGASSHDPVQVWHTAGLQRAPRGAQAQPGTGYDSLPVVLSRNGKTSNLDFLISSDNSKLARLETFDLAKDPQFNIDVKDRPVRGNPDAKVTIINFDDLECGYCARMHQLLPQHGRPLQGSGQVHLQGLSAGGDSPWAVHAAVDANCLASQNGQVYWSYVDYLHAHGQEVNGDDRDVKKSFAALDRIARQEGTLGKLDGAKLDACIAKQDESRYGHRRARHCRSGS